MSLLVDIRYYLMMDLVVDQNIYLDFDDDDDHDHHVYYKNFDHVVENLYK